MHGNVSPNKRVVWSGIGCGALLVVEGVGLWRGLGHWGFLSGTSPVPNDFSMSSHASGNEVDDPESA